MDRILDFFNVDSAWEVVWAHGVNNTESLRSSLLSSEVQMLEGDVYFDANGDIIMAHPPVIESDLDFRTWFEKILTAQKGAKLDFKSPEAVIPCLEYIRSFSNVNIPVFLNQDVVDGPYNQDLISSPMEFISKCKAYLPEAVLSLGFAVDAPVPGKEEKFNDEMFKQMLDIASQWEGHVTICLCSTYLKESHDLIEKYLIDTPYSFSLWNYEPVNYELAEWIKNHFDSKRTFYDFKTVDGGVHRI